jgi:hypothetical protein
MAGGAGSVDKGSEKVERGVAHGGRLVGGVENGK